MFKLTSSSNNNVISGSLPLTVLNTGIKPIRFYNNQIFNYENTSIVVNIPSNNTVTLPISSLQNLDDLYNTNIIRINNQNYIRSLSYSATNILRSGQFTTLDNNLLIQLYRKKNTDKTTTLNLQIPINNNGLNVKDDSIPLLEFCKDWNFYGDITIGLNYKSHPTASLQLIVDRSDIFRVRQYFKNPDNKITLYNIPYRVSSYVENPKQNTVHDEYEISIELEGYYSYPLSVSNPVQVGGLTGGGSSGGGVSIPTVTEIDNRNNILFVTGSDYDKNFIIIGIRSLGSRVGVNITGTSLYARFPKEVGLGSGYVLEDIINSRCRDFGQYPLYSDVNGIQIRDWNTGYNTHRLKSEDILFFTLNDRVIKIGIPPTELTWDTDIDEEKDTREKNRDNSFPIVVYDPPKSTTVITPFNPNDARLPPANIKVLETTSLNFDSSGERSTVETTFYEGDSIVRKIVETYGFAFLSKNIEDSFKRLKGDPTQWWQIISRTETIYNYDPTTGYLLGTDTTGWRLGRYKIESDARETAKLQESDFEFQLYQFQRIPIVARERYVLKQLSDYYQDENDGLDAYIVWDSFDRVGNPIKRYKPNPLYVPKMFVYQQESYYNSFNNLPNPINVNKGNGDAKIPDYTTGEIKRTLLTTNILQSKNTTRSDVDGLQSGYGVDNRSDEDRYVTYTQNFTAQDAGYINNLQIETSDVSGGRPTQHVYKKRPFRIDNSGNPKLDGEAINSDKKDKGVIKTIIYTSPYSPNHIASSTSYSVRTLRQAIFSANTELRENKTFNQSSISLTTFFNQNYKEGDLLLFSYMGNDYRTRIRSISHNISIIDNTTYRGNTTLTLGIESLDSYNVYTKYVKQLNTDPVNNNSTNTIDLFLPVNRGFTLGDVKDVRDIMNLKNRGNISGQ
jgi:hypothetical protein